MKKCVAAFAFMLALAACDGMDGGGNWIGGGETEIPLAGKRISLDAQRPQLTADAGATDDIIIPQMPVNAAWPQAMGNGTGVSGNLSFGDKPKVQSSAEIGEGVAFNSPLIPDPIVADNMVFAMDGAGNISAHHVTNINKVYWKSAALAAGDEDEEGTLLGGGLAWANHTLYAANDQGVVAAVNTSDGKTRWVKELKLPLRSPPRVAGRFVILITADNQIITLMQSSGEMVWSHRGMSEISGKLHDAPPAIRDDMVLASYSSGEVTGLDLATGNPLWNDNLAGSGPNSADPSSFSMTSPLMARGLSFSGSSESLVALESETGRRLWERRVPSLHAPWLAGNYLFLQTPDARLVAVRGMDGMMPWIVPLNSPDDKPTNWHGPVVAGNAIWLVNDRGQLVAFEPQTGKVKRSVEVANDIMTTPVIADQAMYLIDEDAQLYLIK